MTVRSNTAAAGDACVFNGDPNQPFMAHGEIFAGSPKGYTLTPLIQSRITLGEDEETTVDPLQRTIQLRGADVSLSLEALSVGTEVSQPRTNIGEFGVLFAGPLPPNGSVNVAFDVITPAILNGLFDEYGRTSAFKAEVLASVTVRGELGGDEITSTPFLYPISVCNDCVVVNNGPCPLTIEQPRLGHPCNPFQDGTVDCCTDTDGDLVCPGPPATM